MATSLKSRKATLPKQGKSGRPISAFIEHHFRHFNAASVVDAAQAYGKHVDDGGLMMVAIAGAMSTGELGLSLAEMIRKDKIHAICCTGANLEEDIFNLIAHESYVRIPQYRDLTPEEEKGLLERHLNRVTDTCIPETEAMRRIERLVAEEWRGAERSKERCFPHEILYRVLQRPELIKNAQIPTSDSWLYAAMERNLPIFVPGWEDSTLGNMYVAGCLTGEFRSAYTVRSGLEAMMSLAEWYKSESSDRPIGFFQIGGGIAGDFAICVVPMLRQDLRQDVPLWQYFCQISDSTTSYGSYSGASPNEKITWEKLGVSTPKYIIESDATIVAPLLFAHVLGW